MKKGKNKGKFSHKQAKIGMEVTYSQVPGTFMHTRISAEPSKLNGIWYVKVDGVQQLVPVSKLRKVE